MGQEMKYASARLQIEQKLLPVALAFVTRLNSINFPGTDLGIPTC